MRLQKVQDGIGKKEYQYMITQKKDGDAGALNFYVPRPEIFHVMGISWMESGWAETQYFMRLEEGQDIVGDYEAERFQAEILSLAGI